MLRVFQKFIKFGFCFIFLVTCTTSQKSYRTPSSDNEMADIRQNLELLVKSIANPQSAWDPYLKSEIEGLLNELGKLPTNPETQELKILEIRLQRFINNWSVYSESNEPFFRQVGLGFLFGPLEDIQELSFPPVPKVLKGLNAREIYEEAREKIWIAQKIIVISYYLQWKSEQDLHLRVNEKKKSAYSPSPNQNTRPNCSTAFNKLPNALKKELTQYCQSYFSFADTQSEYTAISYRELAKKINERFKNFDRLKSELHKITRSYRNKDGELIKGVPASTDNEEYMARIQQVRSCQATFFEHSPHLRNLLEMTYSDLYKDFQLERLKPLLVNSAVKNAEAKFRKNGGPPKSHDPFSIPGRNLASSKSKLIKQSRKFRSFLVESFRELEKLELRIKNVKMYSHLLPISEDIHSKVADVVEQNSAITGMALLNMKFNKKSFRDLLGEASQRSKVRSEKFNNLLFWTTLLAISALVIPGPQILMLGALSMRMGHVAYAGLIATQTVAAGTHIAQFSQQKFAMESQQMVTPTAMDPWTDMTTEEVQKAMFEGGLAIAFVAIGETLGIAKVGHEAIGRNATRFINWARYKMAKYMIRPFVGRVAGEVANTTKGIQNQIGEALTEAKRAKDTKTPFDITNTTPIAPTRPQGLISMRRESFGRASQLVQAVQESAGVQRSLAVAARRVATRNGKSTAFKNGMRGKYFLDVFIERLFHEAHIFAQMGSFTRKQFVKRAKMLVDEVEEAITVSDNFLVKLHDEVTVASPLRGHPSLLPGLKSYRDQLRTQRNAIVKNQREAWEAYLKKRKDGTFTRRQARRHYDELSKKVRAIRAHVAQAQENYMREFRGDTWQEAREAYRPYAAEFADESKRASLEAFKSDRRQQNRIVIGNRLHPIRVLTAALKKESIELVKKASLDDEIVDLFHIGGRLPFDEGYAINQSGFWFEKMSGIIELVEDHLARFGSQGGLLSKELRSTIVNYLLHVNKAPTLHIWNYVNLTSNVSKAVWTMLSVGVPEDKINEFLIMNAVDCSI